MFGKLQFTILFVSLSGLMVAPAVAQTNPVRVQMETGGPAPYFGVGFVTVDHERARQLHMPYAVGVEITLLEPASPADQAGLKVGDVIMRFNGEEIESTQQFSQMVRETPVGQQVSLEVLRSGVAQTMAAKIGSRAARVAPDRAADVAEGLPDVPRSLMTWRSPMLGVEAESLSGQFAEFFGVAQGVLVRSVVSGSAAETAGLKAGDVIQLVDGNQVRTPADITSRLRQMTGNSVTLEVVRNRSEQNIVVSF